MAPSDDDDQQPGPTPVPPRGGRRKPSRPTGKVANKAAAGKAAAGKAPAGRSNGGRAAGGASRPADNRRAAMAQQKRRRQTLLAGAAVGVVIALVAVFVIIKATGNSGGKSNTTVAAVSQDSLDSFTNSVSVAQLASAASNYPLAANKGTYPAVTKDPPITTTGKPELLYVGAEYCPFCATERWPLVLALSKFGSFHNLSAIHSAAAPEDYPNTATFSFYKSTYTSKYLTFVSKEIETVSEKPLQKLTAAEQNLVTKYDVSPQGNGDIPFVYLNGKATIIGAEVYPQLLAGNTFQQTAAEIAGGQTTLASSVAADAGAIVSNICQMTNGQPGSVCKLFPKPITS